MQKLLWEDILAILETDFEEGSGLENVSGIKVYVGRYNCFFCCCSVAFETVIYSIILLLKVSYSKNCVEQKIDFACRM